MGRKRGDVQVYTAIKELWHFVDLFFVFVLLGSFTSQFEQDARVDVDKVIGCVIQVVGQEASWRAVQQERARQ